MTVSEVTAHQVSRDHFPFTLLRRAIWMAWAAWGQAQAFGYRGDLEGAPPGTAVAAFPLGTGHRNLAPEQGATCTASAVMTASAMPRRFSRAENIRISLVLAPGVVSQEAGPTRRGCYAGMAVSGRSCRWTRMAISAMARAVSAAPVPMSMAVWMPVVMASA